MALYEKRRKKPELMLVPLIDVLTMLIFFAFVTHLLTVPGETPNLRATVRTPRPL